MNTSLTPLWAATTLCFIRSFETRSAGWAALAGAAAAAAMLGEYWSLFLLLGLARSPRCDLRRVAGAAPAARMEKGDRPAATYRGGDLDLAYVMAFICRRRPRRTPYPTQLAPWIDAARMTREGIALACRLEPDNRNGHGCAVGHSEDDITAVLKGRTDVRCLEVGLQRNIPGAPVHSNRFLIFIVPPP